MGFGQRLLTLSESGPQSQTLPRALPQFGVTPGQGNKLLTMTHANLVWSPVAFVDLGVEYMWGHRVTTANFKGDAYALQGSMRVRF